MLQNGRCTQKKVLTASRVLTKLRVQDHMPDSKKKIRNDNRREGPQQQQQKQQHKKSTKKNAAAKSHSVPVPTTDLPFNAFVGPIQPQLHCFTILCLRWHVLAITNPKHPLCPIPAAAAPAQNSLPIKLTCQVAKASQGKRKPTA